MVVKAVLRDVAFSPNSVEADREILKLTAQKVGKSLSTQVDFINEPLLDECSMIRSQHSHNARTLWLSMARSEKAMAFLSDRQHDGDWVVNSPKSVRACRRSNLHRLMRQHRLPVAPEKGKYGYWIKRGDQAAQSAQDVVYVENEAQADKIKEEFQRLGINEIVVSAHVPGDLIKFYGVEGSDFFRLFYPTAEGHSKFGNERRNGLPHYYRFDHNSLRQAAEQTARLTETVVYGGDAIVDAGGSFYIIDFNDWPSFSKCRDDAAEAIAGRILALCCTQ